MFPGGIWGSSELSQKTQRLEMLRGTLVCASVGRRVKSTGKSQKGGKSQPRQLLSCFSPQLHAFLSHAVKGSSAYHGPSHTCPLPEALAPSLTATCACPTGSVKALFSSPVPGIPSVQTITFSSWFNGLRCVFLPPIFSFYLSTPL